MRDVQKRKINQNYETGGLFFNTGKQYGIYKNRKGQDKNTARKKEPTISFVVPLLNLARNPTTSENVNFRAMKASEPSIAQLGFGFRAKTARFSRGIRVRNREWRQAVFQNLERSHVCLKRVVLKFGTLTRWVMGIPFQEHSMKMECVTRVPRERERGIQIRIWGLWRLTAYHAREISMADFLWLKAEHQGNTRGDGDEEFLGITWPCLCRARAVYWGHSKCV